MARILHIKVKCFTWPKNAVNKIDRKLTNWWKILATK